MLNKILLLKLLSDIFMESNKDVLVYKCNLFLFNFNIFFFQAEHGIRDLYVTGVQTCALPICPQAYSGLADGSHTFDVRAIDQAGNVDQSAASSSWTVDTTPPTTTITQSPSTPSPSGTAEFKFRSEERRVGKESRCRCVSLVL